MFPAEIRTDRLRLRRATREVIPPLEQYEYTREGAEGIDEVTEYVSWNPVKTPKESDEFLARCEEKWDDGEAAIYAIFPRDGEDGAGEFAGTAGLHFQWDRDTAVFGIWLRRQFWGRGYSGERARAFFEVAFEEFDVSLCAAEYLPENEQSGRAIQKYIEAAGGHRDGEFRHRVVHDGDPEATVRYSVTQDEWRDATDERTATLRWDDE
ncbi:GNAT family N-acetyltransferase [Halogeometricum borinquense]|uniref:GNAT family N-acetyltransferase n=1 Tax=Halogeometricum borinquense TaxID=60847 RepID=A0A6C0UIJ3_9EURY|nr:GNAT family protein [Halogeometricum borinquense]QIB75245.1 GNAT family N-acetyltransferase [Halogeometricum borinquense]QIQ75811.1 GNAT family N-acetyltransferase [Halogeometricum borinquense]